MLRASAEDIAFFMAPATLRAGRPKRKDVKGRVVRRGKRRVCLLVKPFDDVPAAILDLGCAEVEAIAETEHRIVVF